MKNLLQQLKEALDAPELPDEDEWRAGTGLVHPINPSELNGGEYFALDHDDIEIVFIKNYGQIRVYAHAAYRDGPSLMLVSGDSPESAQAANIIYNTLSQSINTHEAQD